MFNLTQKQTDQIKGAFLIAASAGIICMAQKLFVNEERLKLDDVPISTTTCKYEISNVDIESISIAKEHGYVFDKISLANPSKLIIQIDLFHGHPALESVEDKFAPIQNDALLIFKTFSEKFNVKDIYCDGITERNAKDIAKYFKAYREIENGDLDLDLSANQIMQLNKTINSLLKRLKIFELAKAESYSFRISESQELIQAALKHDPRSVERKISNENREDYILNNMINSNDTVAVVFLGATHNLKENIEKLNSTGANIAYLRCRPKDIPKTNDIHELAKFAMELSE
jgi:hypothetical protein